MVQLLTTGGALDLFKSRVTLKQMEGKQAKKVHQCLQEAESIGSDLVLIIPDPKLNRQATAMLGHWVPTTMSTGFAKMHNLTPTTVGWKLPPEPPTTDEMVDAIMEPIKKITDEFADWKAKHPEEFAQFEKDKAEADQALNDQQDSETANTPES